MKNSVSQSFSIPMELVEKMTDIMEITGKSRSQVVQEALADYFGVTEGPMGPHREVYRTVAAELEGSLDV